MAELARNTSPNEPAPPPRATTPVSRAGIDDVTEASQLESTAQAFTDIGKPRKVAADEWQWNRSRVQIGCHISVRGIDGACPDRPMFTKSRSGAYSLNLGTCPSTNNSILSQTFKQSAVQRRPPAITSVSPVIQAESAEAKKTAAGAIS